ncbi:MAG: SAM-dependent methyltransferase, partial [Pseudomonadota bacterium]|nr:SAM-dependent methyltransferase [Pseudomonadota bacterium]
MTQNSDASGLAMTTGGDYSLSTRGAKDVIDRATPRFRAALAAAAGQATGDHLVIADFGCADGGTGLEAMRQLASHAKTLRPNGSVTIVYEDQPLNDFNTLTRMVQGQAGPPPLHDPARGIYVLASGTSFYQPVLPPGSLHLGISATAMHWLSAKPTDIADHIHAVGAEGAALAAFSAQAARDWETILLARAAELAPGGRLVFCNFCRDEDGRYLGHTGGVSMFATFREIWRQFQDQGRISAAEFSAMTFPQYYRTVEEFAAPLRDATGPVTAAGLRLETIETGVTPCPYAAAFARDGGDAASFARAYVPTLRSWSESTFFNGLSARRPEVERRQVIEDFYQAYVDR